METIFDMPGLVPGASFKFISDEDMPTCRYYLYSPSHPNLTFGMSPMLNALVYLFTDKPCENEKDAWSAVLRSGLLEKAESTPIFLAIPVPVNGNSWEKNDYASYYQLQYALSGGKTNFTRPGVPFDMQYKRMVYNNRQYCIGEGSGASFINNVLTQSCNRIAGVVTFGGEMDESLSGGAALPAYLTAPCEKAVEYFKFVNGVDISNGDCFMNSVYPLKRVAVKAGGKTFDAEHISDAWDDILSGTARVCVDDNIVVRNDSAKIWILQEWPNTEKLGVKVVEHKIDGLLCYDFVPSKLPEKPAVMLAVHGGGDDPIYHAASNGWVNKCAEEGFIVVSADYPASQKTADGHHDFSNIADHLKQAALYAIKQYDADPRRVYISGFSAGGSSTGATAVKYPDIFAACVVMGSLGYTDPQWEKYSKQYAKKYDMPFGIISGSADTMSLDENNDHYLVGVHSDGFYWEGQDRLFELNKLPFGNRNCEKYPYWGYPTDQQVTIIDKDLKYHVGKIYKPQYKAPIAELILFEDAGHAHSSFFATLCWDFMKHFAREADGCTTEL